MFLRSVKGGRFAARSLTFVPVGNHDPSSPTHENCVVNPKITLCRTTSIPAGQADRYSHGNAKKTRPRRQDHPGLRRNLLNRWPYSRRVTNAWGGSSKPVCRWGFGCGVDGFHHDLLCLIACRLVCGRPTIALRDFFLHSTEKNGGCSFPADSPAVRLSHQGSPSTMLAAIGRRKTTPMSWGLPVQVLVIHWFDEVHGHA